ncbi:hypothetical protein DLAC_01357 [Tieghemostelium lacteum]|uniref:RSE1/DDB1/CPSF1 first beta-propeller domain-containing protein n=1 Tax=Tieghemostelium lacteum TaxID=361077 RepID=A0A152A8R8_TIELA|nr:hypothetical protein DLAC_01357 [Tieghemostelium lacteum]|eukprot:KYR02511.1 hypothetical protein DLAC_01357 [Tieghemostelium lacteum]
MMNYTNNKISNQSKTQYYSKTIVPPSQITKGVCGNFRKVNCNDIVLIKQHYLELLKFNRVVDLNETNCVSADIIDVDAIDENDNSFESVDQFPLFSIVKDIKTLSLKSFENTTTTTTTNEILSKEVLDHRPYIDSDYLQKDLLVVTSDSGVLSVLSWSNVKHQFLSVHFEQISPSGSNFKYIGEKIYISPCNRLVVVSAILNNLLLFTTSTNRVNSKLLNNRTTINIKETVDKITPKDVLILSVAFSYQPNNNDIIYLLIHFQNNSTKKFGLVKFQYSLSTNTLEFQLHNYQFEKQYDIIQFNNNNNNSSKKTSTTSLMVSTNLSEIILVKNDTLEIIEKIYTSVGYGAFLTSYLVTDNSEQILLSNDRGNIYRIDSRSLAIKAYDKNNGLPMLPLSMILNLGHYYYYLIGDLSDSIIIRYNSDDSFQPVIVNSNYSCITDFEVLKNDINTQILCCCNSSLIKEDSLKLIEKSISIELLDQIQVNNTNLLWTLDCATEKLIVISCLNSTKIYRLRHQDDWLDISENSPFILNIYTVYACIFQNYGIIVQVTPNKIIVLKDNKITDQWSVSSNSVIVSATSSSNSQLLVSLSKPNHFLYFEIENQKLIEKSSYPLNTEISSIYVSPIASLEHVVIIGTYQHEILIINYRAMKIISRYSKLSSIPHSIILNQLSNSHIDSGDQMYHLIVAQRDGYLLKWDISLSQLISDNEFTLISIPYQKRISNSQIQLVASNQQGIIVISPEKVYYLTSRKAHTILTKISDLPSNITHSSLLSSKNHIKPTFLFIGPTIGLSIVKLDFSKKINVSPQLIKSMDSRLISPIKILNIESMNLLLILFEKYLTIVDPKTLQKLNCLELPKFAKAISIYFWEERNLIILSGNDCRNTDRGLLLIYSFHLDENNSELLKEEQIIHLQSKIYSFITIGSNYILLSTLREIKLLNLKDSQSTPLINQVNQLSAPIILMRKSSDRILLGSWNKGIEIYQYKQQSPQQQQQQQQNQNINNNNNDEDNDEDVMIVDQNQNLQNINNNNNSLLILKREERTMTSNLMESIFLNNDRWASLDRFGNMNIKDYSEHDIIQDEEASLILLDSIGNFSYKEAFMKILPYDQNNGNKTFLMAGVLGSLVILSTLTLKIHYDSLLTLQIQLSQFSLTRPLLLNDHSVYRSELEKTTGILDGDLISQFLYLNLQNQLILVTDKYHQYMKLLNSNNYSNRDNMNIDMDSENQIQVNKLKIVQTLIDLIEKLNDKL